MVFFLNKAGDRWLARTSHCPWRAAVLEVSWRTSWCNPPALYIPLPFSNLEPISQCALFIRPSILFWVCVFTGTTSRDSSLVFKTVDLWLRAWLWGHSLSRSYTGHCVLRKRCPFWALPLGRHSPPGRAGARCQHHCPSCPGTLLGARRTLCRGRV